MAWKRKARSKPGRKKVKNAKKARIMAKHFSLI